MVILTIFKKIVRKELYVRSLKYLTLVFISPFFPVNWLGCQSKLRQKDSGNICQH